jgi:hypothetical protein
VYWTTDHVGISCQGVRHHDITWFSLCLPCDSQPVNFLIEMIIRLFVKQGACDQESGSNYRFAAIYEYDPSPPGNFPGTKELKRVPLDRDCVGVTLIK